MASRGPLRRCRFCGQWHHYRNVRSHHEAACLTPPVCVCARPEPDAIGECAACLRPYKPDHDGLMAARRRWIERLRAVEPIHERPSPAL